MKHCTESRSGFNLYVLNQIDIVKTCIFSLRNKHDELSDLIYWPSTLVLEGSFKFFFSTYKCKQMQDQIYFK